jgi:anti-sigma factor RsiW
MTELTCEQAEVLLPALVDGQAGTDAPRIAAHLQGCASCRRSAEAQAAARAVMRARAAQLSVPAPPGLRTRVAATIRNADADAEANIVLGWRGRLSAFAAAILLVMAIGSLALPALTTRSTVLLAAQMALDHLKCFVIDGDEAAATITKADAEATLNREYGLVLTVPDLGAIDGMRLIAVRRCLYGDGRAAHLLYLLDGAPVSLFIIPGLDRPAAELSLLDHDQIVWNDGHSTYMLVARSGAHARLQHVASSLRNEAK